MTATISAVTVAVAAAVKMTADYMDATTKAARAAGASVTDYSALVHAANLSGVETGNLGKALRALAKPSEETQEKLQKLGISMRESSGQYKTQSQLLYDVADKMKNVETPAGKAALAVGIFGKKGASMVNMLKDGSVGLKAMTDEAARMGLVFDEKAGEQAELFNDNITRLTSSIKGATMTATQSIITFVNQSGIVTTLAEGVQVLTGWWRNLDEDTKKMVTTFGAAIAAVAGLVLVIAGMVAIAPMVGSAITVMTGGLNLVVVAVAAAIAAIVVFGMTAVKYWDQVKSAVQPMVDAIRGIGESISSALAPIGKLIQEYIIDKFEELKKAWKTFKDLVGISDDTTASISILGTVVKTVFAYISTVVLVTIQTFKLLYEIITGIVGAVWEMGKSIAYASSGQMEEASKSAGAAVDKLKKMGSNIAEDFKKTGDGIKKAFTGLAVTAIDTKAAKKSIDDLRNTASIAGKEIKDLTWKGLQEMASSVNALIDKTTSGVARLGLSVNQAIGELGKVMEKFQENIKNGMNKNQAMAGASLGIISGLAAAAANAVGTMVAVTEQKLKALANVAMGRFEYISTKYMESLDEQLEATKKAEEDKLQSLKDSYDSQIEAVQSAENTKNSIISAAAAERQLIADEEYQAARDVAELEYEAWIEEETMKYEAEQEMFLTKAIDKEQRMLVEALMDADFKGYMENKQGLHDQKMKQMAIDWATKKKGIETQAKTDTELNETQSKDTVEALTEQKAKAVAAAEETKNKKLAALEAQRLASEKQMKKMELFIDWQAQRSQIEQTKGMRITETVISGVAGAAAALAMGVMMLGPIAGLIVGGIVGALVLGMMGVTISQISSQSAPPPVGLFLADGGVLSGPSHSSGGIQAELEGGEAVVDKVRTQKMLDS